MKSNLLRTACAVALCAASAMASAQVSEPAAPAEIPLPVIPVPVAPPAPTHFKLPALTLIEVNVVDELSSKTATVGQTVHMTLAAPVYLTADLGIPKGTPVVGVVIHTAKGGMGGKSGELLVGAKAILVGDGVTVPLRSLKLGPAKGKNNETLAFATAVAVGLPALLINGGSARIPAGSIANAKTSADSDIPVALLSKLPPIAATATPPAPATPTVPTPANPTQGENK